MTSQEKLVVLKKMLSLTTDDDDIILEMYLESAKNIICEIRYSEDVESVYELTQIKIAVELYSKIGVEGQTYHGENGLTRSYENSGVSKSLLDEITPVIKTPFSEKRWWVNENV